MPDLHPEEMRVSGRGGTLRRPEAPVRLGYQVMETIPVRKSGAEGVENATFGSPLHSGQFLAPERAGRSGGSGAQVNIRSVLV